MATGPEAEHPPWRLGQRRFAVAAPGVTHHRTQHAKAQTVTKNHDHTTPPEHAHDSIQTPKRAHVGPSVKPYHDDSQSRVTAHAPTIAALGACPGFPMSSCWGRIQSR
eukprot:2899915-Prymnesium_polylepis.1